MKVNPIPDGYPTVSPYLIVDDVARLIEFLKKTFDAMEIERQKSPDGRIMHAEVKIGDSIVMLGQTGENNPSLTSILYLYLEDADAAYQQALVAGVVSLQEPINVFYEDRTSGIEDEFGNQWWLVTHIEDVSREEMLRRAAAQAQQG